jgi:branched-chain amino acid transport system permease protein
VYQQSVITGLTLGVAYGIMGLGFTLIYRSTRVLNLAHGAVVALVAMILTRWTVDNVGLRVLAAVLLGMALMGIVHILFMVPFMGSAPVVRLTALVGALFIGGAVAQIAFGTDSYILDPLKKGNFDVPVFGGRASWHLVVSLIVVAVVVVALRVFFTRTIPGKSLRAIADDVGGARIVGIRTGRALFGASLLAGGLAGLASTIVAARSGVNFTIGFEWTLIAVTTAIVGGVTSEYGAIAGGLLVGLAQGFMLVFKPELFLTITFGMLIVTLALRPEGLFGHDAAVGAR